MWTKYSNVSLKYAGHRRKWHPDRHAEVHHGHYDDIGIFVEGVIILDNTGSEAQACAVMLGVIYALNPAYPTELRHYTDFIQKVLMQMDGENLSSKVLGLKNKISVGL